MPRAVSKNCSCIEGLLGRILLRSLCVAALVLTALGQSVDVLRAGHWIEAKGQLTASGNFAASSIEVLDPEDEEFLVGAVTRVDRKGGWIVVLGQRVSVTDRTRLRNVSFDQLLGERVKVEGYYRGLAKFSARTISLRGDGRDRVGGRIDAVRRTGNGLELDVMRFLVEVRGDTEYEQRGDLSQFELSEARSPSRLEAIDSTHGVSEQDDDDYLEGSIRISDTLRLGLRGELRSTTERDFDLDGESPEDRRDLDVNLRGALGWNPLDGFYMRLGGSHAVRWREDEKDGSARASRTRLTEAYGYWRDVLGAPVDVQVGRQDFYVEREWLWDENLDALRLIIGLGDWHLQLAAATTLNDGSPREEATERYIAYLTREVDNTLLGAYVVDQRTNLGGRDYPIHFGLRALGDWIPDNESWAEVALVRGYEGQVDLRSHGFDVGTTWKPSFLDSWYFSAAYAFGSGDRDATDTVDHAFRQTGIQDNNGKLGGVTSFRYYGELFDPELSNMHILTLGVGRRFGRRSSLDLVYHRYDQDRAFQRLRDTSLDMRPNGRSTDLGQELDLVFGNRTRLGLDTEVVMGAFDPGAAFDDARRAYLVKLQFRYRF
jgi:alginate production protein